ncbi:hypothetical protein QYM36_004640 [Artemia franciscana]|uniref:Uncharacterized protein n=1 Tax=Artemia franciscana TaxID=6661 RepID=A0AA88IHJ4_ARTSF|nr:hypothetical protein QYM36_004640 [Artemia franciscana]
MESRLFGLTLNDLRALAYQLAERNDIAHRYQTEIAGKFWVDGFFKEKSYSVDSRTFIHTKNLEVKDYARDNGVSLLCLPPQYFYKLQSLDVSFMKPLSLHYADELRKWLRCNPGEVITYPLTLLTSNKLDLQPKKRLRNLQRQRKNKWENLRLAHLLIKKIPTLVGIGVKILQFLALPLANGIPGKKAQFNMDDKATPGCCWMRTDMNDSYSKGQRKSKWTNQRRRKTAS